MVAELAAMKREQASVFRRQWEQLQDRSKCRMLLIEDLAAQMGSWPTLPPPPPASLDCMGVADVPMPASRVRPAREQPTSAPLTTLWVGAAGARQVPSPFPVPRKGQLSNLHSHHLLNPNWWTERQRDLLCQSWGSKWRRDVLSLS